MKILIIEDEFNLADAVKSALVKEKYDVTILCTGDEGLYEALYNNYDLIILDVMLPNMNGFEILKKLKEENIDSKIIMLTAKSTLEDKLEGLENGCDDYMTKPFHVKELVARVNVQLKRINNISNGILKYKDIELDIRNSNLKCTLTNESVSLVCKELKLLEYFMNNKEHVLTKDQIYNKIWGAENEIESNNLEAYLSFIRRKLKAIGSSVNIKAIRNIGYRLE